jgi:hypothetical protein
MMKMTQDIRQWIRELQAGHNIVTTKFPALARSTKSKTRKRGKKLLRKYVWDAYDNNFNLNNIMSNNEKIFLGVFKDIYREI